MSLFHRKRLPIVLIFSFMALLLSACSSIQVSQDYDKSTDFSQLKHYQWLPTKQQTKPKASNFETQNPLIAKRIIQAVEANLNAKGTPFNADKVDAYVTYHVSTKTRVRSSPVTTSVGFGTYGRYGSVGFQTAPDIQQYEEGKLVIDIIDLKGQLLWRGTSSSIIQEHPTPEESTAKINEVVTKMLAQYPPMPKQTEGAKQDDKQAAEK